MSYGYYAIIRVTDMGPYVTKIVLPVGSEMKSKRSDLAKSFSVFAQRMDDLGETLVLPKSWMAKDDKEPSHGYIPVRKAYPSNRKGEEDKKGAFVTLEMAYGPQYSLSAAITSINGMNAYIRMRYTITQVKELETAGGKLTGRVFDYPLEISCPDTYGWINSRSSGEKELALGYGYYIPQVRNAGKRPLIIWLHGAGEGGSDPTVSYTGNKAVAFSSEKIQAYFGGAYVLAPQTPTFWMDDGSGQYHDEGKTIYGKALKACIDEFIEKNPGIDKKRIYIGGDSNGGFMTMRMVVDYPKFFAAAFPVCEALFDKTISDKNIAAIKHMPIWFVHAKNDPVVDPNKTAVPTYERLLKAGAENVHMTYWDKIEDIRGAFDLVNGKPFEYLGHFAWIHVYNDDCQVDFDGKPVTVCVDGAAREVGLLEWLSFQSK